MSVLVADPVQKHAQLVALQHVFVPVTRPSEQASVNQLLDAVKAAVQAECDRMGAVPDELAQLSWFTDVSAEELALLATLLHVVDTYSYGMVRYYVKLGKVYQKLHLDRTLRRRFKKIADELQEVSTDLRDRFFVLPHDPALLDLMQQLGELA